MKFMPTKESIFIAIVLAVSTSMISFSILNANAQTENIDSEIFYRYFKGCN